MLHQQNVNTARDEILKSHDKGTLLRTIYERVTGDDEKDEPLLTAVAGVHNEGIIDAVAVFGALKYDSNGADFFLTRHVFEKLLPRLEIPVQELMPVIAHLYREAGQDMASGTIISSFIEFCVQDSKRAKTALGEVESSYPAYADLMVAALIAVSRIDPVQGLSELLRLAPDERIEIRRRILFAVGLLDWGNDAKPPAEAFAILEKAVMEEIDDDVNANVVRSTFALFQHDKSVEERAVSLTADALAKGGEVTIHTASEIFGSFTMNLSEKFLNAMLPHFIQVRPANKGTVDCIDRGISHLIRGGSTERALQLLEDLLSAHPKDLTMNSFDRAARNILANQALMNKVTTRWLLRGERVFGDGVNTIVAGHLDSTARPEVDPVELPVTDIVHLMFLARKAIGYLFFSPLSAASFIVSLVRLAPDDAAAEALQEILFDPLLLNFSGRTSDFLDGRAKSETDPRVKGALESSLHSLESYLDGLHSVGNVPEFHPSEMQRIAQRRQFSQQMTESFKHAEEKSVFLSLISKITLLYGRKSIGYVYGPEGTAKRMETALGTHGTEIEFPRMQYIDPFGLDYMLRVFRNERMPE